MTPEQRIAEIQARWKESGGFTGGPDKRKSDGKFRMWCHDCGGDADKGHDEDCSWLMVRDLLAALASSESQRAQAEAERDEARGCPHGNNCACAIGSRHSWLEAFSRERNQLSALSESLRALVSDWRLDSSSFGRGMTREFSRCLGLCADKIEALLNSSTGSSPQQEPK